jgi:uncharacterized protein (TIGR03790 family)
MVGMNEMMTAMRYRAVLCVLLCAGAFAPPAYPQTAENVALVINDASADSRRIGEHYASVRNIPGTHIIHLTTATTDNIARAAYAAQIELPIAEALRRENLQDRVLYIVLTKGVPLRVDGTPGQEGTVSSVDSELTLLYRRMTGRDVAVRGRIPNPYFLGSRPLSEAAPFSHRTHDIYLVTRLTGFTVEDALALIGRGRTPGNEGRFVLDQRGGVFSNPIGDRQLAEAQQRLADLGLGERVVLETTTNPARKVDNVLGYYSWGSNDPENRVRRTEMRFAPGAIAAMFVSGDARTFDEPPADWTPTGDFKTRTKWFQGSPQSLAGDLIREGITGVAGHVAEPYLQSAVQPQVLFPAYASGFNLAEAFYLALPDLSWQSVIVGDPLCAPFTRPPVTADDLDPGVDVETEYPVFFAARRNEVMRAQLKGAPAEALTLFLRAESRLNRANTAGAREALEAATRVGPDFVAAQLQLGLLYEEAKEYANARQRYQEVLRVQPNNAVALNNLAYGIAVHEKNPNEGLPLARRAYALFPKDPRVVDTLAWIEHLNGNSAEAARLLRNVVQRDIGLADVHLHAATIFAAVGDHREAERQLSIALKRDSSLEESDEVKQLRARLRKS